MWKLMKYENCVSNVEKTLYQISNMFKTLHIVTHVVDVRNEVQIF